MNMYNQKASDSGFKQLVGKLKTEDANYATISRVIQVVYWILIPLYMIMTIRHYADSGDSRQLLAGACMILAFLIFALFFGKYYREYKNVNYALPTIFMLKEAAYRYKPFQGKIIWVAVALGLMDAGLFINQQNAGVAAGGQIVFVGAVMLGLAAGLIIWYIRYKPLRDEALRLIAEIEGN